MIKLKIIVTILKFDYYHYRISWNLLIQVYKNFNLLEKLFTMHFLIALYNLKNIIFIVIKAF